jgi:uncharacterized protein (DUF1697 family)
MIAFLRGINVGGHHMIKMDELRKLLVSLKLKDPQTYLQSGNVIFETAERDEGKLAKRIENAIEHAFGFRPAVILRTAAEIQDAVARNPFAGRADIEPNKLLVVFLADEPTPDALATARLIKADPEELHIDGREAFIYYAAGMARPKLSWPAVERALKTSGTGRNWNTVTKLLELANGR